MRVAHAMWMLELKSRWLVLQIRPERYYPEDVSVLLLQDFVHPLDRRWQEVCDCS